MGRQGGEGHRARHVALRRVDEPGTRRGTRLRDLHRRSGSRGHKNNKPFKKFDEILQHEMLEEWGRPSLSRRALHPTSTSDLAEPAPNATAPRSTHRR